MCTFRNFKSFEIRTRIVHWIWRGFTESDEGSLNLTRVHWISRGFEHLKSRFCGNLTRWKLKQVIIGNPKSFEGGLLWRLSLGCVRNMWEPPPGWSLPPTELKFRSGLKASTYPLPIHSHSLPMVNPPQFPSFWFSSHPKKCRFCVWSSNQYLFKY